MTNVRDIPGRPAQTEAGPDLIADRSVSITRYSREGGQAPTHLGVYTRSDGGCIDNAFITQWTKLRQASPPTGAWHPSFKDGCRHRALEVFTFSSPFCQTFDLIGPRVDDRG